MKNGAVKNNSVAKGILFAVILIIAAAFIFFLLIGKKGSDKTAFYDMTDTQNTEYGAMYYSPLEEEHIAESGNVRYVDNEVLVTAKSGTSREKIEALAKKYSAEIVGEIAISDDYQLRFNDTYTLDELKKTVKRLSDEPVVDIAIPDFVDNFSAESASEQKPLALIPTGSQLPDRSVITDPNAELNEKYYKYGSKWDNEIENTEEEGSKSWGFERIKTVEAWALLKETQRRIDPVRLGLIDGGFNEKHEDLKGCFAQIFYDCGSNGYSLREELENASDSGMTDDDIKELKSALSHGTHVAGTMAANTANSKGICGVYPYGENNLYGVSFSGFEENNTTLIGEKLAFAELIVRNVKVINCSFGQAFHNSDGFSDWYSNYDTDPLVDSFFFLCYIEAVKC